MTRWAIPDHSLVEREEIKAQLDAAVAAYSGPILEVPGFERVAPARRSSWVDPEAVLKRKKPAPPPKVEISEARVAALAALRERKKLPPEQREPTLVELARRHGMSRSTLQRRLSMGMSLYAATTIPPLRKGPTRLVWEGSENG